MTASAPRAREDLVHAYRAMVLLLLPFSSSVLASDMPAMPGSYWEGVLLLLLVFPINLFLLPALVLLPAVLVRTTASRSRQRGYVEAAVYQERSRKLRIWVWASLVPWFLVGVWILLDAATNSF